MEQTRYVVAFFDPSSIVALLAANPVVWYDTRVTGLHGIADQAGQPPTAAVAEFIAFVDEYHRMPTQSEYGRYCLRRWRLGHKWPHLEHVWAVQQKMEHNFYPSMIDTFHAFGLVAKAGWYDQCWMDTYVDVAGKRDITFVHDSTIVHVNLKGPSTSTSRTAETYKRANRGYDPLAVELRMPGTRPKGVGNKRWYQLEDFSAIMPLPGLELGAS